MGKHISTISNQITTEDENYYNSESSGGRINGCICCHYDDIIITCTCHTTNNKEDIKCQNNPKHITRKDDEK